MRRSVLVTALALLVASGLLAAPGTAAEDPPAPPARGTLGEAREALQAAEQALGLTDAGPRAAPERDGRLGGAPGATPGVSLALRDLALALPRLQGDERTRAERILARPTDRANDPQGFGYASDQRVYRRCTPRVCVHWVAGTRDRPRSWAWIKRTLRTMDYVFRRETRGLGYRRPLKDTIGDGPRANNGGDGRLDVYLKDIGQESIYGYCAAEPPAVGGNRNRTTGYCTLDDDFARAQFNTSPVTALRATAAHEFFHAVQYNYDVGEDGWLLESTATWMEEQVFDGINDNRRYLRHGQVRRPRQAPLDTAGGLEMYGNWAFFEHLSGRYGRAVVRGVWNQAGGVGARPDRYSTRAVHAALAARGTSFRQQYANFASANVLPASHYPEGGAWPSAPVDRRIWLGKDNRRARPVVTRLDHHTSRNLLLVTDSSLTERDWKIQMSVRGPTPRTGVGVQVMARLTNGRLVRRPIRINENGYGRLRLRFNDDRVRWILITVGNGSLRFTNCYTGTPYSCGGNPVDDGVQHDIRARIYR